MTKKNLWKALFDFQNSITNIKKDSKANRGKFATLQNIRETIKPILEKCSLLVSQKITHNKGGNVGITTFITHVESGEREVFGTIFAPSDENKNMSAIQNAGSNIKYMRRYAMETALGLTTIDDSEETNGYTSKGGFQISEQELVNETQAVKSWEEYHLLKAKVIDNKMLTNTIKASLQLAHARITNEVGEDGQDQPQS